MTVAVEDVDTGSDEAVTSYCDAGLCVQVGAIDTAMVAYAYQASRTICQQGTCEWHTAMIPLGRGAERDVWANDNSRSLDRIQTGAAVYFRVKR